MKDKRKQVCLRLSVDLNSKLIQIAEHEELSKNTLIVRELKKMVRQWEAEQKEEL